MEKNITDSLLKEYSKEFNANLNNKIAKNAVNKNGVFNTAYNSDALRDLEPIYSVEVKDIPEVTNQKQSGRCWMFAGLNVLRPIVIKNLKVKSFEFSESYLMFYDKLEKSNSALIETLNNLDIKDDDRLLEYITGMGGHQDGGYWNYFTSLVKKYGVCPKSSMKETVSSSSSSEMNEVLLNLLTKDIALLRNEYKNGKTKEELTSLKEGMLKDIYNVLAICLGEPTQEFIYEYEEVNNDKKDDKDIKEEKKDSFKRIKMSPIEFYNKYIGEELNEYVSLVNWPISSYKFNEPYMLKLTQNVHDGDKCISLNVSLSDLKEAAINSLKDNTPMWFACDVTAFSFRKEGYLVKELLNIDDTFSVNTSFDKGDRLMLKASQCNHAMTLVGVNLDDNNKPNRWKVMNSWGDDIGFKGFFIMSDEWFNEYTYEIVIKKKYIKPELLKCLDKELNLLEPWAPVARISD